MHVTLSVLCKISINRFSVRMNFKLFFFLMFLLFKKKKIEKVFILILSDRGLRA
jgi:hypothetical protein